MASVTRNVVVAPVKRKSGQIGTMGDLNLRFSQVAPAPVNVRIPHIWNEITSKTLSRRCQVKQPCHSRNIVIIDLVVPVCA
jgi:hypothetical protein